MGGMLKLGRWLLGDNGSQQEAGLNTQQLAWPLRIEERVFFHYFFLFILLQFRPAFPINLSPSFALCLQAATSCRQPRHQHHHHHLYSNNNHPHNLNSWFAQSPTSL